MIGRGGGRAGVVGGGEQNLYHWPRDTFVMLSPVPGQLELI